VASAMTDHDTPPTHCLTDIRSIAGPRARSAAVSSGLGQPGKKSVRAHLFRIGCSSGLSTRVTGAIEFPRWLGQTPAVAGSELSLLAATRLLCPIALARAAT